MSHRKWKHQTQMKNKHHSSHRRKEPLLEHTVLVHILLKNKEYLRIFLVWRMQVNDKINRIHSTVENMLMHLAQLLINEARDPVFWQLHGVPEIYKSCEDKLIEILKSFTFTRNPRANCSWRRWNSEWALLALSFRLHDWLSTPTSTFGLSRQ